MQTGFEAEPFVQSRVYRGHAYLSSPAYGVHVHVYTEKEDGVNIKNHNSGVQRRVRTPYSVHTIPFQCSYHKKAGRLLHMWLTNTCIQAVSSPKPWLCLPISCLGMFSPFCRVGTNVTSIV